MFYSCCSSYCIWMHSIFWEQFVPDNLQLFCEFGQVSKCFYMMSFSLHSYCTVSLWCNIKMQRKIAHLFEPEKKKKPLFRISEWFWWMSIESLCHWFMLCLFLRQAVTSFIFKKRFILQILYKLNYFCSYRSISYYNQLCFSSFYFTYSIGDLCLFLYLNDMIIVETNP